MRGQNFVLIWIVSFILLYVVIVFGSAAIADSMNGDSVDVLNSMLANPGYILLSIVLASIFGTMCYCCGKTQE